MPNRGKRDGKGVEGHSDYFNTMYKLGIKLHKLQAQIDAFRDDDFVVHSLKLIEKGSDESEWLVILCVDTTEGAKVGFSSGASIPEALSSLVNRLANNSMKWRVDEYRNG